MAEAGARERQYEYRQNSNLVLHSSERPKDTGPTGEVTTWVGKMTTAQMKSSMGDRTNYSKPADDAVLMKSKKRREKQEELEGEPKRKMMRLSHRGASVITADVENIYRPQTPATKNIYEVLLSFIQKEMGDKPHDVLRSAADEVIAILKDASMKNLQQKKEIEGLFRLPRPMDEERWSKLVNIGSKITDYRTDDADAAEDLLGDQGVPVVFDEEEEEDDLDDYKDDSEEEDDDILNKKERDAIESKLESNDMIDEDEEKENELDARTIDAFWIQRKISGAYKDALQAQKISEQVYKLLADNAVTDRTCENKLVGLLGYDKFDLIKLLLRNRLKVVYCIRLARASEEEKESITTEMEANPKLLIILAGLRKTTTAAEKAADLGKTLIKEARDLRKSGADRTEGLTQDAYWSKRQKSILDLESLEFTKGGHMLASQDSKLMLPENSKVIRHKNYQEVHIPPVKRSTAGDTPLVHISKLPEFAQKGFAGMTSLNRIQSTVYESAFNKPDNLLVCAPTGAGKTNIAMLTMLREIGLHQNKDGSINTDAFKIVYIAPMKSLVQEMVTNFGQRLEPFGITVRELSGDSQLSKEQIESTQVIVTTPEKWDIVTRKSGERTYTQLVRLVIIDEVHLLHDTRGPVLESVVARTIRQVEETQELIRLVGLSATLPNYKDVATFLRVNPETGLFFFDNSFRPCPLQQQYIGITQKKAFKRHQLMNEITYQKVIDQAGKNQCLIFVHSRKETATTARTLRDMALEKDELGLFLKEDSGRQELLREESENVKDDTLKEILPYGFGIHHAGMTRADRQLVEELMADGHIQVLVSTATLAWGVNLPAHTVIVKGTQVYSPEKGEWVELSPQDIMQMMGRAGRPQYDTYGEGIIITSHKELQYYLSLLNEHLPIESQFISRLADNLNAEIVMGAVQNVKEAVNWLGYTYLYVRMLRRPTLYGIKDEDLESDPVLEQRRVDLIHTAAAILDKHNLIKYDRKTGNFHMTDLGRVASHYYISYQSMAVFNEHLKATISDIELFRVFSLSSEFKYLAVRPEEKAELSKLMDHVPIPIKESLEEGSAKVNVLLQTYISRLRLEGFALMCDMVYITQSAGRIMRALYEIVLKRGWASAAVKVLNVCKMIKHRMWGAQSPLRQFNGIPSDIIKRIEGKDFPWERFYDLEAHAIGELIRYPKMGKKIHKCVHQLPRLDLQGHVQPITRTMLKVELLITPDFQFDPKIHGSSEPFWIIVEDVDGEAILHHEYFILKQKYASEEHPINFTIPIFDPLPPQYFIRVVSDRWLGSECVLPISFRNLVLPERYPPPTELLDLQPMLVTELANEKFINFFAGRFEHFNPIQTQVFPTVFNRDDSTLVAAPTGSGKTVVAELAILRMLTKFPDGRCVYIAPLESLCEERYIDWTKSFSKLGVVVHRLTGEISMDLRLLQAAQIVISTPEAWDVMSRRWKTRKNVQTVKLFICDELHLILGEKGPTLEVIVSRMRYIASQTENPIRVLGLSTSVANSRDLGEWIGATPSSLFSFHPNVRLPPLEIHVQGFDITNFYSRQLAMIKPTYMSIVHHSPNKPVIVFVHSRKQARRVALDIMTYASAENENKRFLHAAEEDLEPHLKYVRDASLKDTLSHGVGFYHSGLDAKEKAVVGKLFDAEAIQVIVAEYSTCWGMSMAAHLVVIMGCQEFNGREHRYVDLPITDLVQMMGRACRPLKDTQGKCTILCQASKKEYYLKFLYDPFPVESHLDHYLADHLNAEIITKRVENFQDAVDYLTFTFLYRRITQNPNYYGLQGSSHDHQSGYLSDLVENTLEDLKQAKCVTIEDMDVKPLNLGMIAAFYYIKHTTVEVMNSSLKAKSKLRALLEILSSASEFDQLPVRHKEDVALKKLSHHLPVKVSGSFNDPHTKANVLLQAHFSRINLTAAVKQDQAEILPEASRLLQAMVDVLSSNRWLESALGAMELSQMVTQGVWHDDSPLLQIPGFDRELVERCQKAKIDTVPDLIDMDDKPRKDLLQMSNSKLRAVAEFCNVYPDIEVSFAVNEEKNLKAGGRVNLTVTLERDEDEEETGVVAPVVAPLYPKPRSEGWWLVLGDTKKNDMVAVKRVALKKNVMQVRLDFIAPAQGEYTYTLYLLSDSYMGCDKDFEVNLSVGEGVDMSDSDDSSDESS